MMLHRLLQEQPTDRSGFATFPFKSFLIACFLFVCLFVFFTNLLQPSTFYLSPILHKMSKRDVTLLDRSEKSVRVTLWGDYVSTSLSNQSLLMALAVLYVPDL